MRHSRTKLGRLRLLEYFLPPVNWAPPFPNHNQPIHLVITVLVTTVIDHHHSHTLAQGAGVDNRGKVFCFSLSLIYEWN